MKRLWLVSLLAVIAVLITSVPIIGAAPDENPGKGPIDKIIFVHYPKNAAARPEGGRGTPTGVLCPDYKYSGIRWESGSVSYSVNTNGSGAANALEAIQASFSIWDGASSGLTFNYGGPTSKNAGVSDQTNVVCWGTVTYSNAIAVTYIWYYRLSRTIYECDTVMNKGLPWSYTPIGTTPDLSGAATADSTRYADPSGSGASGSFDIRNIMTHEAGHWIMLGDLYTSRDSYLTMYGYGSLGEIKKDTLGYGDELGLEKAYGP